MSRGQNKERLGFCAVCNKVKHVITFRGMKVCTECLLREANPPTVDEFIYDNRSESDYSLSATYHFE